MTNEQAAAILDGMRETCERQAPEARFIEAYAKGAQALRILAVLEGALPMGLEIGRRGAEYLVSDGSRVWSGESLVDALGQMTTTLELEKG